jgi:hypothetical protein
VLPGTPRREHAPGRDEGHSQRHKQLYVIGRYAGDMQVWRRLGRWAEIGQSRGLGEARQRQRGTCMPLDVREACVANQKEHQRVQTPLLGHP